MQQKKVLADKRYVKPKVSKWPFFPFMKKIALA
jgi:hypothetical protein